MSGAEKLVRMANGIAAFFRAYPEPEAVAGIHDHLAAFWTPRMRAELEAALARGLPGIDPLVAAAIRRPGSAESPAHREAEGPGERGAIGSSDAG